MVNALTNKLFQFEMVKEGEHKETFLFWLASDIMDLLKKVKERGLEYNLTPHERKVLEEAIKYYDEYNKIFLKAS